MSADFRYGKCECVHGSCPCSISAGPAVFTVIREGRTMRVCTKCDLSTDRATRILLVQGEDPVTFLDTLMAWDALGGWCVLAELQERKQRAAEAS